MEKLIFPLWEPTEPDGDDFRDSLLEDSNRYHLDQGGAGPSDDLADDNNEAEHLILGNAMRFSSSFSSTL